MKGRRDPSRKTNVNLMHKYHYTKNQQGSMGSYILPGELECKQVDENSSFDWITATLKDQEPSTQASSEQQMSVCGSSVSGSSSMVVVPLRFISSDVAPINLDTLLRMWISQLLDNSYTSI